MKDRPNDAGLFRQCDESEAPPKGMPSILWDFKSDDPNKLIRFIAKNSPLVDAYWRAINEARKRPGSRRRNARVSETLQALRADGVEMAIHEALVAARVHWGEGNRSPRASFIAGWKLSEALYLWAKGEELLRKRKVKIGKALNTHRKPGPRANTEKSGNKLWYQISENAWPDYQEEAGDCSTKTGFVEWLKSVGEDEYSIIFDETENTFRHAGFEAKADTVRKRVGQAKK